jgi:L-asparagine transporter-like permease
MIRAAGEEPKPEQEIIRARQRDRARITAWLLGGFVVLMFLIAMAKVAAGK